LKNLKDNYFKTFQELRIILPENAIPIQKRTLTTNLKKLSEEL